MDENDFSYDGAITLTGIDDFCIRMIKCDDGELRECACLPIGDGCVRKKNKYIALFFRAISLVRQPYGHTHKLYPEWTLDRFLKEKKRGFFAQSFGFLEIRKKYHAPVKKRQTITVKDI